MKTIAVPILSLVVAGLAIAVVVQGAQVSGMMREVDRLKDEVRRMRDETRRRVALQPPSEAPRSTADIVEAAAAAERAQTGGPAAEILSPEMAAEIERVVQEKVEARIKGQKAQKEGEKKPPLAELVKELALDPSTEARMAEVLNAAKDETFALLRAPRLDGNNFADEFVSAMLSDNAEADAGKVWLKLFSEKIPGTDETYVARIMTVQQRVNGSIQSILTAPQWQSYQHMALDPLQIQTGYDPWAAYFQQKGVTIPD